MGLDGCWLLSEGGSAVDENVDGSILPMKVQRFLFGTLGGESAVSFGTVVSAVSILLREPREEWRL